MSLHVGGRGPGHLVRTGGAFYPTATAAFDFQLQQYRNGVGTYSVSDLSALTGWSYSGSVSGAGATVRTALNSSGAVVNFANGVPRITDVGELIEEARTNSFLNSAVGATQSVTTTAAPWTLSFYGTGSITLTGGATGTLAGTGASNRVSLTVTATAASTTLTVTGSVTNVQFEAGASMLSYIPAAGAAVTRSADLPIVTGAGIATLAQGTMTASWKQSFTRSVTAGLVAVALADATTNRVQAFLSSSGKIAWRYSSAGVDIISTDGVTTMGAGNHKLAVSWGPAGFIGYVDGVQDFTSALTPGSNALDTLLPGLTIGTHAPLNDTLARVAIYGSQSTAGVLQALTQ